MGGGLRKPALSAVAAAAAEPATIAEDAAAPTDAELDAEEERQARREAESAERQRAAVAHVVENLFAYAPVAVQTHVYPRASPKAGQAYLWITVDEAALQRRGATDDAPVRYPVGVAVDADGNVFVSDCAVPGAAPGAVPGEVSTQSYSISGASIAALASSGAVPAAPRPPALVSATQHSLAVRWTRAADSTVDRYELQYRRADSPNRPWAALAVVAAAAAKNVVALDGLDCHSSVEFRARAHNPAGWSAFSAPSTALWTLPGPPATPQPPIAGAVADTYASLFWAPSADNGAPPVVYTLEQRDNAAADGRFRCIYEGTGTGFVATGLAPRTSYAFRLRARNAVGETSLVDSRAVRTLAQARAEVVELPEADEAVATSYRDRWVQCWDPATEQVFFFNRYTSQRVTHEPPEVARAREAAGAAAVEQTPEMLFRRKRFRFHRELRQALTGAALGAALPLELRRERALEDTAEAFARLRAAELAGKPRVRFRGEPGIDSGGLTKDWFLLVSRQAAADRHGLFRPCDGGRVEIDPGGAADAERLRLFRFLGVFLGKAIFDRQALDLPVYDVFYKHLLGLEPGMDDLRATDAQLHRSLQWMLEHSIADVIDETFSVAVEDRRGGSGEPAAVVDLKEDGRDIPVTDANKREYVDLVVQWRTAFGVRPQMDAVRQGLAMLVPPERLRCFDLAELKLLVNGRSSVHVDELRAGAVFQGGYNEHSQVVLWLWQALREFSPEQRGQFLKFVTGTSKVPLDGFDPPLNITRSDLDALALPRAHTCFNQLVLPEYQSFEVLVDKIGFAIANADGFELS